MALDQINSTQQTQLQDLARQLGITLGSADLTGDVGQSSAIQQLYDAILGLGAAVPSNNPIGTTPDEIQSAQIADLIQAMPSVLASPGKVNQNIGSTQAQQIQTLAGQLGTNLGTANLSTDVGQSSAIQSLFDTLRNQGITPTSSGSPGSSVDQIQSQQLQDLFQAVPTLRPPGTSGPSPITTGATPGMAASQLDSLLQTYMGRAGLNPSSLIPGNAQSEAAAVQSLYNWANQHGGIPSPTALPAGASFADILAAQVHDLGEISSLANAPSNVLPNGRTQVGNPQQPPVSPVDQQIQTMLMRAGINPSSFIPGDPNSEASAIQNLFDFASQHGGIQHLGPPLPENATSAQIQAAQIQDLSNSILRDPTNFNATVPGATSNPLLGGLQTLLGDQRQATPSTSTEPLPPKSPSMSWSDLFQVANGQSPLQSLNAKLANSRADLGDALSTLNVPASSTAIKPSLTYGDQLTQWLLNSLNTPSFSSMNPAIAGSGTETGGAIPWSNPNTGDGGAGGEGEGGPTGGDPGSSSAASGGTGGIAGATGSPAGMGEGGALGGTSGGTGGVGSPGAAGSAGAPGGGSAGVGGDAMKAGGSVPGKGDRDTVPAKLTPGEFVVRKPVAEHHEALLERLNREGAIERKSRPSTAGSRMVRSDVRRGR